MNILLIDDEPILFQDILRMGGYCIDVALNGYEGLELLVSKKAYDLVILDVRMPVMDGWETLRHIRDHKQLQQTYVIMLTANDLEDSIIEGLNLGADEYFTKPISPKLLLAHVQAFERRISKLEMPEQKSKSLVTLLNKLTPREREIASLMVEGLPNKAIAKKLCISDLTVKNHLVKAFKKLGVDNRTQAAYLLRQLK